MTNTSQNNQQTTRYLVVGSGQSGLSVAEYFAQNNIAFDIQDDRETPPNQDAIKALNTACRFLQQDLSAKLMSQYDSIVVSPGISIQTKEFILIDQSKTEVIGDIELFARANKKPVVAITGSNGKTTVTALMGAVLKACGVKTGIGGNIGQPALSLLAEDNDINVLELSSFQLETTSSLAPTISVVLNVSEDHLDRYENFEHYQKTKMSVHNNTGFCIENRNDENTFIDAEDLLTFGLDLPEYDEDFGIKKVGEQFWLCQGDAVLINTDDLKIRGQHNWANCLAVLAMADVLDLSLVKTLDALVAFEGIEHRYELVAEVDGIRWINDTKATNPGAALAAIEGSYEGNTENVILIVGGQSKQADLSVLNDAVKHKVSDAIVLGEDAELFIKQWQGLTNLHRVDNIKAAVKKAKEIAKTNDCVLLAPACASFDQYVAYPYRGVDFKNCVKQELGL